jgi:DNA-binding beta-propeller fold protein YncE
MNNYDIFKMSSFTLLIIMLSLSFFSSFVYAEFDNVTGYKFVIKWGGAGEDDGQFLRPHDLDFSQDEEILYAIDRDGNRVQAFDKNGNFLFKWGEIGQNDGQFHVPYGMEVDVKGNVWIADRANDGVQKFDSEGNFIVKLDNNFGKEDSQFQNPEHLAVDSEGNVYVSDRKRDDIEKFAPVLTVDKVETR